MLARCLKDAKNAKTSNTCFFKGFNSIWQVFLLTTRYLKDVTVGSSASTIFTVVPVSVVGLDKYLYIHLKRVT